MVRALDRIWVRFGVYMAITVLLTVGVIALSVYLNDLQEQKEFLASLPANVRAEMNQLIESGQEDSQAADDIYDKYWVQDGPGISVRIIEGIGVSLFLGLIAAFISARVFIKPLSSVIEAALRIAQGDLSVRANTLKTSGELNDLIQNFNFMANSLERLERERKETVATMSHELRTPLTILQGRLHALCDGVITANDTEFRRLLDHTEHLGRLVDDLHTLSLVEAGKLSLHLTYFELGAFLQELIPFYTHRAAGYGVNIELKTEPVFMSGDKDRLRQVMANLIENTLHYAASGGLLSIRVTQENNHAILELSDRGSGLSDGEIKWVFNPFYRGDSSYSVAKTGSGLGLSIVQRLVKLHNGTIEVSNRAEGGACFRMIFPLAENS